MNGFSGYNQTKMDPFDIERLPSKLIWAISIKCHAVWSKNVCAIYKQAFLCLFHEMLHDVFEDYGDDIVKSKKSLSM